MKRILIAMALALTGWICAAQTVELPAPNLQRETLPLMQTLKERKSVREFSSTPLSQQDLSDLLWAAQGRNREDGRLTSPTAKNAQEIRVYLFNEEGVSLYDPQKHTLTTVVEGDHRDVLAGSQKAITHCPLFLLMVADITKYGRKTEHAYQMVCCDVGIVSENINIFCASAGLCTVPRGIMDHEAVSALLGLGEDQLPILNNPVGYSR